MECHENLRKYAKQNARNNVRTYDRKNVRFHVEGAVKNVRRKMPDTFQMVYQKLFQNSVAGDLSKKAILASCGVHVILIPGLTPVLTA